MSSLSLRLSLAMQLSDHRDVRIESGDKLMANLN